MEEQNAPQKEELLRLYELAVKNKLCATKKEFAELVGASRSAVTAAMNGDTMYLTHNLIVKCARALEERLGSNFTMTNCTGATGNTQNNYATDTTTEGMKAIVDRLVGEMAAQRESYEKIITALIEKVAK